MRPKNPVALFSRLYPQGESIKVSTAGQKIATPTGNPNFLATCNEYKENQKLVSIAESPFGGLKGSGSPDYCPGTISINSGDGVYLTDINGQNTAKTLTAGKLAEVGSLSVDTENHTITEEFIIKNTSQSNDALLIGDGSSTDGFILTGAITSFTSENGRLKLVGHGESSNGLRIRKTVNLSGMQFIKFSIECNTNKTLYAAISQGSTNIIYRGSKFALSANVKQTFVLPILAPASAVGQNPNTTSGTINWGNSVDVWVGTAEADASDITIYFSDIQADVGKPTYLEISAPNILADTSAQIYTHDGTAYQLCEIDKLDSAYSNVSQTSANCTFLDGTKLDDVFGSAGAGRAVFPKGSAGDAKAGSSESITYSNNLGTDKRIGLRVNLPPSDDGRTSFNSIRIKVVLYYSDLTRATDILPDLSGNENNGTMVMVGLTNDRFNTKYAALKFSGLTTGFVNCGDPAILRITGQISIDTWIQIPDLSVSFLYICGRGVGLGSNGNYGYYLSYLGSNKSIYFDIYSTTVRAAHSKSNAITDNNWHHVVVTWDGTTNTNGRTMYIDGVIVSQITSTISEIGAPSNYNFFIGKNSSGGSNSNINISSVRIYNRCLTQEEVTENYNGNISTTNLVGYWKPKPVSHMGSTSYEFGDSNNASYGLQNIVYPWITIYSPNEKILDIFRFTYKPKKLVIKRDETGTIYEVEIFPDNGPIYHGRMFHPHLTLDSNSDNIPDCLSIDQEGSVAKLLKTYAFVDDWFTEADLSTSSIVTNDYGITADSLDIIPYAISEGDSVSDINNHVLPVAETVNTISGNVSLVDVRGLNTIRVRDTAYTNAGECKVWDTVTTGNTNENTWKRVFVTDWVFTGDTVIENGLIKVVSPAASNGIRVYNSATTVLICSYYCFGDLSLISISTDRVEFKFSDVGDFTTVTSYSGTHWLCRGSCVLAHDHMVFYPAAYDALTYSITKRFMLINEQLYDAAVLKTSQIVTTVTTETIASFNITDSTIGIYITNKTPDSVRPVYTSGTTWSSFRITKENFKTLRRADVGSIPFNCSMLYFEAESMGLSNGAVYYTGTDAYPGSGNTGITLQVTGSKTYSNPISFSTGDYLVFMRAQSPGSGRLSLNLYSGVNVQKSVRLPSADTAFSLVSATLSISSADAQVIDNFKIYNGTTDPVTIDYILFIPISLIKKYAQRALWQALPATKVIKKLPR